MKAKFMFSLICVAAVTLTACEEYPYGYYSHGSSSSGYYSPYGYGGRYGYGYPYGGYGYGGGYGYPYGGYGYPTVAVAIGGYGYSGNRYSGGHRYSGHRYSGGHQRHYYYDRD
jgi:hypothetical protein